VTITGTNFGTTRGSSTVTFNGIPATTTTSWGNTSIGVTTLKGGTTIVGTLANGGVASDLGAASSAAANLVLNGGTLQYSGAAVSINRLFSVGTSGGTIANEGTGPLTLNNPAAITLSGALTLSGSTADTNTLAAGLIGGGSVIKSGTGTWILTGTNTYGGGTVVASGVLQVGANGGLGTLGLGNASIAAGSAIDFERTGTLTVPGAISGNGAVSQSSSGRPSRHQQRGGRHDHQRWHAATRQRRRQRSLYSPAAIVNNSLVGSTPRHVHHARCQRHHQRTGNVIVRGGGFIKAIGTTVILVDAN
jgi:autotransporter-associated beta strand protein